MLKNNVMERVVDERSSNQQMIGSDDEDDSMDEITFIRNLSDKEKTKLMKKFIKLQSGETSSKKKKKEKKKKKKSKKQKYESSEDSDSESENKSGKSDKAMTNGHHKSPQAGSSTYLNEQPRRRNQSPPSRHRSNDQEEDDRDGRRESFRDQPVKQNRDGRDRRPLDRGKGVADRGDRRDRSRSNERHNRSRRRSNSRSPLRRRKD